MVKIDREKAIAIIEIRGTPKISDVRQAIEALLENPDHSDGMDEIWDFREASLTAITTKDLQTLAIYVSQYIGKLAKRTAFVVKNDLEYGIGRMWEVYAEDAPQKRQLFRDIEDAFDWLSS